MFYCCIAGPLLETMGGSEGEGKKKKGERRAAGFLFFWRAYDRKSVWEASCFIFYVKKKKENETVLSSYLSGRRRGWHKPYLTCAWGGGKREEEKGKTRIRMFRGEGVFGCILRIILVLETGEKERGKNSFRVPVGV